MLSVCGNPACHTAFSNSEGGFFLTDSIEGLASAYVVQILLRTGPQSVCFFWACDVCSRLIHLDANGRLRWAQREGMHMRPAA